jgi:hypothetical protein
MADHRDEKEDLLGLSADGAQIPHQHHEKDNDADYIRLYIEKSIIHLHSAIIARRAVSISPVLLI